MDNLDFYAKIEPLLGFYEAYEELYECYLDRIHEDKKLLDVGCGNGRFLKHFTNRGGHGIGIDLSPQMVKRAGELGVEVYNLPLHELEGKFETIVAIADVLNYMDKAALERFFNDIVEHLEENGSFICDINTLYGFEEIAGGQYFYDDGEQFFAIEGIYEEGVLTTNMTLFERVGHLYTKESHTIGQHYHTVADILQIAAKHHLALIDVVDIALFGEESDKVVLEFHYVCP
jgi:cyclopropane fatty-acyl-phospholipid synthase-like methyltransferase